MRRGLPAALGVVLLGLLLPPAAPAQDSKPTEVRVGALVSDIQQLDLESHSYNVDLYRREPTGEALRCSRASTSWPRR